jgi:hypothetical protein
LAVIIVGGNSSLFMIQKYAEANATNTPATTVGRALSRYFSAKATPKLML